MYYTGSKTECENYNNTVASGENYSGVTNTWAYIVEHPDGNLFAIWKHDKYECGMQVVEKLGSDWFKE